MIRYFVDYGTLHIVNVNQSDEGRYTCTALTSLDQDSASATVTVLGETHYTVDTSSLADNLY